MWFSPPPPLRWFFFDWWIHCGSQSTVYPYYKLTCTARYYKRHNINIIVQIKSCNDIVNVIRTSIPVLKQKSSMLQSFAIVYHLMETVWMKTDVNSTCYEYLQIVQRMFLSMFMEIQARTEDDRFHEQNSIHRIICWTTWKGVNQPTIRDIKIKR